MATASLLMSPLSIDGRKFAHSAATSAFLPIPSVRRRNFRSTTVVACFSSEEIPKQFRSENLREGLMDNFKNFPSCLYGLTPSQMEMLLPDDYFVEQQAKPGEIDEETLTAAHYYTKSAKLNVLDSYGGRRARTKIEASSGGAYYGRDRRGSEDESPPPDLPSFLLDRRIVYLGLPLYEPVTELIVAELLYLDLTSQTKPIYLYINSTGTEEEDGQLIGPETEAFAIADCLIRMDAPVHTLNCGVAYGQAAMLLSLGEKGYRSLMPGATTKLYLPEMEQTFGDTTEMYIMAKDLEAETDITLEFLERGIGKPRDVLNEDLQHGKFFQPLEAIKYGVADRIAKPGPGKDVYMGEDLREYFKQEEIKKKGGLASLATRA